MLPKRNKFGKKRYDKVGYERNDFFMFGSEINGLTEEVYSKLKGSVKIYIPMIAGNILGSLTTLLRTTLF